MKKNLNYKMNCPFSKPEYKNDKVAPLINRMETLEDLEAFLPTERTILEALSEIPDKRFRRLLLN